MPSLPLLDLRSRPRPRSRPRSRHQAHSATSPILPGDLSTLVEMTMWHPDHDPDPDCAIRRIPTPVPAAPSGTSHQCHGQKSCQSDSYISLYSKALLLFPLLFGVFFEGFPYRL